MLHIRERKILGFTLIELLIVVSVIGILSGLLVTVINPTSLRARARDSQRIADLKKIQTALELRFADTRDYPSAPSWQSASVFLSGLSPNYYTGSLPTDPNGNSAAFACNANFRYSYRSTNGSNYILTAKMETTAVDYEACSSKSNCAVAIYNCSCAAAERCHAVQNTF